MKQTNILTKNNPSILVEAGKGRQTKNWFLHILIFIGVFFAGQIISAMPLGGYMAMDMMAAELGISVAGMSNDVYMICALFSTGIATVITLLYVKFMEDRSMYSVGFVRRMWLSDWAIGSAAGVLLFALALGICVLTGAMKFEGFALGGKWGMLALFFVGFLIQGMSEEVICRGYLMNSIAGKGSVLMGIIVSSVIFAVMHLGNANIGVLPLVNLALFGVLEAVVVLRCDSIWLASGIHSLWNFAQGNIFGVAVSGSGYDTTIMRFTPTEGMDWLSGGAFGIEGGIACTVVLLVSIAVTLVWSGKQSEKALSVQQ